MSRGQDTRVPIGRRLDTGELVDASEVPRGKRCDCICPSCKVPLIASQGETYVWHFRHDTRGTYEQLAEKCRFSLWVALALMARQELKIATEFQTPGYVLWQHGDWIEEGILQETVTEPACLALKAVEIEAAIRDQKFDALMDFGTAKLGLLLSHPEKPAVVGAEDMALADARVGIIRVDLEELWSSIPEQSGASSRSRARFRDELLRGKTGKRWMFHPREVKVRARLEARVREAEQRAMATRSSRVQVYAPEPELEPIIELPRVYRRFECVACGISWKAFQVGLVSCSRCGDHLMVSPQEVLEPPA